MTKVEIIDQIVNKYNLGNRGSNGSGGCVYLSDEGNTCAVGMTLIDPGECEKRSKSCVSNTNVEDLFRSEEKLWEAQKEEYRGHSLEFWGAVQQLHDLKEHWDMKGITKKGLDKANYLKLFYQTNP